MNPKLPLALCLLAAAAYWWTTTRDRGGEPVGDAAPLGEASSAARVAAVEPPAADAAHGNPLVAEAAEKLLRGPPLHARARFKIDLLEQRLAAPGDYWQQGDGSRKTRLEFRYRSELGRFHVLQVCDGRYFYWYRKVNDQSHLEYVDLQQIRKLDPPEQAFLAGGRAWDAVGGLSSLLDHLAKAFAFEPAARGELDGVPVFILRGRWRLDALNRLLEGQVDGAALADSNWWRAVPAHVPHAVEFTLAAEPPFELFPYRIVFFRYEPRGEEIVARPTITFELFELQQVPPIDDATFHIAPVNCDPVDVTAFYVDRVEQFTRR